MDPSLPDPERLKWTAAPKAGPPPPPSSRPPQRRRGELYLGPMPWGWLSAAAHCGGKALHVALVLWLEAVLTRKAEVRLRRSRLLTLGVLKDAGRRGLDALEGVGLVSVVREPGKGPRVRLLDVPDTTLGTKPGEGVPPGPVN